MIDGRRGRATGTAGAQPGPDEGDPRRGIGGRLVRLGVSANLVTAMGVLLAAVNAVVIGAGYLWVACALLLVGGLMDTLDGIVAKAAGTASPRGAFLDSVADRVSDALLFGGLAWYLAVGPHPREALLPVAILGVSSVISYERAKAESLGFTAKGGLMERAERMIVFGLAICFHWVMIPILWVLLVLVTGTAVGRFVRVWRQASGTPPHRRLATAGTWGHGRVESRWRQLRETGSAVPGRASAPGARWRNRRSTATLSTRFRQMLSAEHATGAGARPRRSRPAPGSARTARALRHRVEGREHWRSDDGRSS